MHKLDIIKELKSNWRTNYGDRTPKENTNLEKINFIKQISDFFGVGSYYYFIFNFETLEIDFISETVEDVLGVKKEEATIEKILEFSDTEDLEAVREKQVIVFDFLFNKIPIEQIQEYKITYLTKVETAKKENKIILHQSRVLELGSKGELKRVLCIQTDITDLQPELDSKITFTSTTLPSFYAYEIKKYKKTKDTSIFSKREIEIIEYIAKGFTEIEIGTQLHISPLTVKTHKKKIFKKAEVKNTAQLVANCIRENII